MTEKELKEIEKTIGINLDIIDNTIRDTNFYLERIAIAIEKIAIHIRKEE
jgi:hypothetical protein